jgi:tight adherence protein B
MGIAVTAVFIAVLTIVFGAYLLLVVRPEQHESGAIRKRLRGSRPRIAKTEIHEIGKSAERLSTVELLDSILRRWTALSAPLKRLIEQSGLQMSVGSLVLLCIFTGTSTAAILSLLTPLRIPALALGVLAAAIPIAYVRRKTRQRLALFEEQFPEAIDLIARALRAGHALPTALQLAGEEVPDPVGSEFRLLYEQQNYGLSMTEAFRAFGERMPLLDARFFVTAVQTQREMGGNLSEVLDKLAAVIRERFKVRRQVRAISAHGRITGVVLGLLPPAVAIVLFVLSPAQMRLLIDDPLGVYMVVGAIFLQVIGVVVIRRIVEVEV